MRLFRSFLGYMAGTIILIIVSCVLFFSYNLSDNLLNVEIEAVLTTRVDELQHHTKNGIVIDSGDQFNDIVLKQGACNGTIFPLQYANTEHWCPLDKRNSIYVISAYMIRPKNTIFIIGAKLRPLNVEAICQMWKLDSANNTVHMEISQAHSSMPQEGFGNK